MVPEASVEPASVPLAHAAGRLPARRQLPLVLDMERVGLRPPWLRELSVVFVASSRQLLALYFALAYSGIAMISRR